MPILVETTTSVAVYIGKVVRPIKDINDSLVENDDENVYLIPDIKQQISFLYDSKDKNSIQDKILKQNYDLI